jgi:uncharacterized SAM-dependent methyltransferase
MEIRHFIISKKCKQHCNFLVLDVQFLILILNQFFTRNNASAITASLSPLNVNCNENVWFCIISSSFSEIKIKRFSGGSSRVLKFIGAAIFNLSPSNNHDFITAFV